MKRFGFLVVAFGLLGLNACGGSDFEGKCNDACTAEAKCTSPSETEAQCKTSCTNVVALNTASSCTSEADDYAGCIDVSSTTVCSSSSPTLSADCQTKQTKYTQCLVTYCTAHSTDTACTSLGG